MLLQLSFGSTSPTRVAYQGVPGAYSEMAAMKACPGCEPLPCEQFEVAFQVGREAAREVAFYRGGDKACSFFPFVGGGKGSSFPGRRCQRE